MTQPPTIPYASRRDNRPAGGVGAIAQFILGFFSFFVALASGVAGTATRGSSVPVFWVVPLVPLAFAIYARIKLRWRGFLPGYLSGLGLLLLAMGACFIAFANGTFKI